MRSLRDSPSGARLLATKPNSIGRFSTMLGTGNRSTRTMHSKVIELPPLVVSIRTKPCF